MGENYSNCWRFLVGNIGTLPNEHTGYGKIKIDKWKNLATKNIDLNIISELNKDMGMLPRDEKLENLTKGWWNGLMCRLTFLKETDRAIRTLRQPGGVALLANWKCTSQIIAQGSNARHFGR